MNFKKKSRRAFTLIEIMLAITIFSLVLAAIYSVWNLVLRSSKVGQDAAAQAQRQRITMHTIEDALACIQSFQASIQYYTFIVQNGDQPMLSFTARLPDDFPRNGRFGDFNVRRLTFTIEAGPNRENDLMLRQNPILMDMDADEQQHPLVLARNVKNFTIECWDTNQLQWNDEWDQTNSLPSLVRIGLVIGGNKNSSGSVAPEFAITRIIAIPVETLPSAVQTGGAGGGGGIGVPSGNNNPNNPNNANNPGGLNPFNNSNNRSAGNQFSPGAFNSQNRQ
ncbi:MAG: prepilin-type N-terminal cleavage/methylation domain-containing protein [Verrucomicrobiota bacterium]|jgi:type II secretion system protein J